MRSLAVVVLGAALAASGCGGSDGTSSGAGDGTSTAGDVTLSAPEWAAPLLSEKGPEGAAVLASSDFAAGTNRVTFLLVRSDNGLVRAPVADVVYESKPDGPVERTTARLVPIGVDHEGAGDVKDIYVTSLELPTAGKHWMVIKPRGVAFQGYQILDVAEKSKAVAIGERAPASDNPTTETMSAERITTANPPDTELLRHSIAESLEDGVPFVVAFATPAFCQSRTCGPTVDVVEATRKRFEDRGVRFIHVEIYEDNLPGNGVNRWVSQWRLPTEPWVYVVGRDGVVRDRFEGAVSVDELAASVKRNLLS